MTCETNIRNGWDAVVRFAESDGEVSADSLNNAHSAWQSGEITAGELQAVNNAWQAGCELIDGVVIEEIEVEQVGGRQIRSTVSVSTGGRRPVNVDIEFSVAGAETTESSFLSRGGGVVSAEFSVDSPGEYEVCAGIVSVRP